MSVIARMLNAFVESYIETAIWSSTDDDGKPLDKRFNASHLLDDSWLRCVAECADFLSRPDVVKVSGDWTEEDFKRAGHDFWLTRNGHGAGFWDGGWPNNGKELSIASMQASECNLFVSEVDGEEVLELH